MRRTTLGGGLAAWMLALAGTAHANGPSQGCPTAYDAVAVTELEAIDEDYRLPRILDTTGNQDGLVCALALPEAIVTAFDAPVPLVYQFRDNNLPAKNG